MFSNTSSKYVITRSHAINLLPLQTKSTSIACPVTKKLNCIHTSLLSTGIMSMEGAGETLKEKEFLFLCFSQWTLSHMQILQYPDPETYMTSVALGFW